MMMVLAVAACMAVAQDDKPWEKPGTESGQEIIGPDGGVMVWVPAGEFLMGSTDEQIAALVEEWPDELLDYARWALGAETPQRTVYLDGFWLGKHEVTNAQYGAFCAATGREFPSESSQADDHPVVGVSWEDALAYAEHHGLSLPTEAQWEYAGRGAEGRVYPWGDEWDPKKLCWGENKAPGGQTAPVGSHPDGASWCRALDMAGNVYEWCADWFDPDYYKAAPTTNPTGPAEAVAFSFSLRPQVLESARTERVLRGGSWNDGAPLYFRGASRSSPGHYDGPGYRVGLIGFRCARTVQ